MKRANIAWNLLGLGAPLIIAAIAIPKLIEMIGLERFGLLALSWGLIGFSGMFDLGIGRAATQYIAHLRGSHELEKVPSVVKTAERLSFYSGLVGMILLTVGVLCGAQTYIKYSIELSAEVTLAAYLLAVAIPIQSMSAMFRGVNEAFENFKEINLVRIGLGATNFIGPLFVSFFTSNLAAIVFTLLVSRMIAFFFFRKFAKSCLINQLPTDLLALNVRVAPAIAKKLLSFGGWFTVSCVVGPILLQAERYFIGVLVSATAVSTFSIPYEVVIQCLIIVGAISSVAFPSFSALAQSNPEEVEALFRVWFWRVAVIMLTVCGILILLLPIILPWWIGSILPIQSVFIGQILCVGIFFNSLGTMYFMLLHVKGRADITAKLHLLELPIYLAGLYYVVDIFGVVGAAFMWTGRMMLDLLLIWVCYARVTR
jgi:O-antigen/teichoic acid export membrane protein